MPLLSMLLKPIDPDSLENFFTWVICGLVRSQPCAPLR